MSRDRGWGWWEKAGDESEGAWCSSLDPTTSYFGFLFLFFSRAKYSNNSPQVGRDNELLENDGAVDGNWVSTGRLSSDARTWHRERQKKRQRMCITLTDGIGETFMQGKARLEPPPGTGLTGSHQSVFLVFCDAALASHESDISLPQAVDAESDFAPRCYQQPPQVIPHSTILFLVSISAIFSCLTIKSFSACFSIYIQVFLPSDLSLASSLSFPEVQSEALSVKSKKAGPLQTLPSLSAPSAKCEWAHEKIMANPVENARPH